MKFGLVAMALFPVVAWSQAGSEVSDKGFHRHDGFYLSMNIGPALGDVEMKASGGAFSKMVLSGGGAEFEFRIGGAPIENLIVSADLLGRSMPGPDIEVDGQKGSTNSNVSAGDNTLGVGLTYYFMPFNAFVSGTIGVADFSLETNVSNGNGSTTNTKSSSKNGIGIQLKGGKEWWVSKNWGLGAALSYAHLSADDKGDPNYPDYKGTLSTNKISLLFNTTFN